jgi:hypothetical protein
VFDDCQDMVRAVSKDLAFKARHRIGTVNSINWARVSAQVVYDFKGYFVAATTSSDQPVSFCVPSGKFGSVAAGHIAQPDGPADRQTGGRHQRERTMSSTSSSAPVSTVRAGPPRRARPRGPSMDIFEGEQLRALHL